MFYGENSFLAPPSIPHHLMSVFVIKTYHGGGNYMYCSIPWYWWVLKNKCTYMGGGNSGNLIKMCVPGWVCEKNVRTWVVKYKVINEVNFFTFSCSVHGWVYTHLSRYMDGFDTKKLVHGWVGRPNLRSIMCISLNIEYPLGLQKIFYPDKYIFIILVG